MTIEKAHNTANTLAAHKQSVDGSKLMLQASKLLTIVSQTVHDCAVQGVLQVVTHLSRFPGRESLNT